MYLLSKFFLLFFAFGPFFLAEAKAKTTLRYLRESYNSIVEFTISKQLFRNLCYNFEKADSLVDLILISNDPDHLRLAYSFSLTNNVSPQIKGKLISQLQSQNVHKEIIDSSSSTNCDFVNKQLRVRNFISLLKNRDQIYRSLNLNTIIKNQSLRETNDSINSTMFVEFLNKEVTWPSYYFFETIKEGEKGLHSMNLNLYVFLIHQIHSDPKTADKVRDFIFKSFEQGKLTFGEFLNYEFNYIMFFPAELFGYGRLPGLSRTFHLKTNIAQIFTLSRFLINSNAEVSIIFNTDNRLSFRAAMELTVIRDILICFGVSSSQLKFDCKAIHIPKENLAKIISESRIVYKIENKGKSKISEVEW